MAACAPEPPESTPGIAAFAPDDDDAAFVRSSLRGQPVKDEAGDDLNDDEFVNGVIGRSASGTGAKWRIGSLGGSRFSMPTLRERGCVSRDIAPRGLDTFLPISDPIVASTPHELAKMA